MHKKLKKIYKIELNVRSGGVHIVPSEWMINRDKA